MSELTLNTSSEQGLSSIYISIPEKLRQVPVLTNLISNYDLIVHFKAAILDRKGAEGAWFKLALEGDRQDIENGLNYLRTLGVEIFPRTAIAIPDTQQRVTDISQLTYLITDYDL